MLSSSKKPKEQKKNEKMIQRCETQFFIVVLKSFAKWQKHQQAFQRKKKSHFEFWHFSATGETTDQQNTRRNRKELKKKKHQINDRHTNESNGKEIRRQKTKKQKQQQKNEGTFSRLPSTDKNYDTCAFHILITHLWMDFRWRYNWNVVQPNVFHVHFVILCHIILFCRLRFFFSFHWFFLSLLLLGDRHYF